MESSEFIDDIHAGPQIRVIGVDEEKFDAEGLKLFGSERLDACLGPHRHKGRRVDVSMGSMDNTSSSLCRVVSVYYLKTEF